MARVLRWGFNMKRFRIGIGLGFAVASLLVLWAAIAPTPCGACSCAVDSISSQLEPIDGTVAEAPMCLRTGGGTTTIGPCVETVSFSNERFWRGAQ